MPPADLAEQLASAFEQTMHQLTLLGHQLPQAAEAMSPQQLKVLWVLSYAQEPLPMATIAKQLGVTPGTLTETAKRLVAGGYVHRERLASDDRVVHLSLTKDGEKTVAGIHDRRVAMFREVCAVLGQKDAKALIDGHRFMAAAYARVQEQRGREDP